MALARRSTHMFLNGGPLMCLVASYPAVAPHMLLLIKVLDIVSSGDEFNVGFLAANVCSETPWVSERQKRHAENKLACAIGTKVILPRPACTHSKFVSKERVRDSIERGPQNAASFRFNQHSQAVCLVGLHHSTQAEARPIRLYSIVSLSC